MTNKKLKEELDYAFTAHDYDYALLCAKLLQDQSMIDFVKNYTSSDKYEKIFNDMIKFILGAKNDSAQ